MKIARRFDRSLFAFATVLRVAFATVLRVAFATAARGQGAAALQ